MNMKISTQLYAIISLLSLLLVAAVVAGFSLAVSYHGAAHRMYKSHVESLEQLKTISDMYGVYLGSAINKTLNGSISRREALDSVVAARKNAQYHWQAFLAKEHVPEEKKAVAELGLLITKADEDIEKLSRDLARQNQAGVAHYMISSYYLTLDPLTAKIKEMTDMQLSLAKQEFQASDSYYHTWKWPALVSAVSGLLFCWCLAVVMIRRILRQLGCEPAELLRISQKVVEGDLSPIALTDEIRNDSILAGVAVIVKKLCETGIRLQAITDAATDAILKMNSRGEISFWNPAATKILGFTCQEALGKNLHNLLAPERYHAGHHAAFPEFQRSGKGGNMGKTLELFALHKDGREILVELSLSPVLLGGEWHSVGILRDTSERKKVEAELHKLSSAVCQSPVSIVITDTYGTIEFVNAKFTELTGYTAEEALVQNPRLLKSGVTLPETYKKLWTTIAAGNIWSGELCNKRKDGTLFWENAIIFPCKGASGVVTNYIAFKEDITEKKNIMAQLIQSQKMDSIGQMAGGLAHDLNNILSVVNGYATLIQEQTNEDQRHSRYIQEILKASERAAALTHGLLAYSRKQVMKQQNQNLNVIISSVGSFVTRILMDNITFTLSLADDPLNVLVDSMQIEQVLLNLASNARDAMPNGGTFTIATAAGCIDESYIDRHGYGTVGRYAVITISDSGTGMDEEIMRRVFEPFFTTKDAGKGTGLGLAMVMGIIKQHGGFIDLTSRPGAGTVFSLYLPLVEAGEAVAVSADFEVQSECVSGTILIAEDDPDTRGALEEFLTKAGYTVIAAVDGQDALEKFTARKDEIHLVISDVVMPRKSGKDLYNEIRQISLTVKFIFVSGHARNVIEREGDLGPETVLLKKPIMPFVLLSKIRKSIGAEQI